MKIRWPPEVDRPLIAGASSVWLGAVLIDLGWLAGVVLGSMMILGLRSSTSGWWLVVAGLVLGLGSGALVAERRASIEHTGVGPGRVEAVIEAKSDVIDGEYGAALVAVATEVSTGRLPRSPLVISPWDRSAAVAGDRFLVSGFFTPGASRIRRSVVAGRLQLSASEPVRHRAPLHLRIANSLRARVMDVVEPDRSAPRALLAGFLIGETSELSDTSVDSMRRAGLTHFVAVSGSNVALFLLLWWLLLGPLGLSGWSRTVAGLFGLLVFATMTRWEPSVIRASLAAGILLVGRSIGVPLTSWSTLALAVGGALVISGELAFDVGFQLSVLAAVGVMAGSDLWQFRPSFVSTALSASISAQAMVSPVLLLVFGTVPVLSPIANVIAGPLVVAATSVAGVGVLAGSETLVVVASWFASGVLAVAEIAAPWPQIDWRLWLAVVVVGAAVVRLGRSVAVSVLVLAVVVTVWPDSQRPSDLPAAVFLDVGQGDATIFFDHGLTVLVDGGPDPVVLARKLERYGVSQIDAVVVSHVHADHITGLRAVLGRVPVGFIVADFDHHMTPAAEWLTSEADRLGIEVVRPAPGWSFGSKSMTFEFLGPVRRYVSPNDESVVVLATLESERILMSGDMETFAQADLGVPDVDVLKVPHQGAATSDLSWLSTHAGHTAVVSVGPNQFGHPAPEVVDTLTRAGAAVHRTDFDGDLVLIGR